MYILVNTLNNECIDWRPKTDEPFVVGENQIQVCDNFNFEPAISEAVWRYLGGHKFEFRYYKDGRDKKENQYFYNDFLAVMSIKDIIGVLQYKVLPDGYKLFYEDSGFYYECVLNDIDHTEEILDFETNYKTDANKPIDVRNENGILIYSPTLEDVQGLYPKKKMYKGSATAGMTSFFDNVVSYEKHINGGEYWIDNVSNVHEDDYIEFSIVDKNDILGLFSTYGLTVGIDVLQLVKFVNTDYVKKGDPTTGYHSQLFEGIKGTNKVITGLYFRTSYVSHGTTDINLRWRLYYYE